MRLLFTTAIVVALLSCLNVATSSGHRKTDEAFLEYQFNDFKDGSLNEIQPRPVRKSAFRKFSRVHSSEDPAKDEQTLSKEPIQRISNIHSLLSDDAEPLNYNIQAPAMFQLGANNVVNEPLSYGPVNDNNICSDNTSMKTSDTSAAKVESNNESDYMKLVFRLHDRLQYFMPSHERKCISRRRLTERTINSRILQMVDKAFVKLHSTTKTFETWVDYMDAYKKRYISLCNGIIIGPEHLVDFGIEVSLSQLAELFSGQRLEQAEDEECWKIIYRYYSCILEAAFPILPNGRCPSIEQPTKKSNTVSSMNYRQATPYSPMRPNLTFTAPANHHYRQGNHHGHNHGNNNNYTQQYRYSPYGNCRPNIDSPDSRVRIYNIPEPKQTSSDTSTPNTVSSKFHQVI